MQLQIEEKQPQLSLTIEDTSKICYSNFDQDSPRVAGFNDKLKAPLDRNQS